VAKNAPGLWNGAGPLHDLCCRGTNGEECSSCATSILPSSVEHLGSELPQRVAAAQIKALIAETLQRAEMMLVNGPVVLIGKWNPGPGAMGPLVDATFDLLAFEKKEGGVPIGITLISAIGNVLPLQGRARWLRMAWG
jgi:hypothetical protein